MISADGDPAVTHFRRFDCANGYSLAAVRLETGRTHQIRVHMKHIGHPLPGDFLYNRQNARLSVFRGIAGVQAFGFRFHIITILSY